MKHFTFLCLLIVVAACHRKAEDAIRAKGPSFRLIRTDYYAVPANPSAVPATRYEYDADNRIREVVTLNANGTVNSKVVYNWLNGNTLRMEQYYTNPPWSNTYSSEASQPLELYSYNEITYNPDTTVREEKAYLILEKKADYRSYSTYEYDAQNRVKRKNSYTIDHKLASYTLSEYDAKGNVTKETFYSSAFSSSQPNTITTYEYDNGPNPYSTVRLLAGISWYKTTNNIIRQQSVNLASGITTDERWTYEYRPDGYPARMIYADGRKEAFIYSE